MTRSAGSARAVACLLASLSLAACHTAANLEVRPATLSSHDVITEDDIATTHARTAYDVIKTLRANFLSYRGETSLYNTSSPLPTVYLDDQWYGPMPILASIPAEVVASIRMYRAWDATTKFGTGNMGGVIAVYTKH
jgi:hypothetical protein